MTEPMLDNQLNLDAHTAAAVAHLSTSQSRRVYLAVYEKWQSWCSTQALVPFNMTAETVSAFLASQPVTMTTRNLYLSAMRNFAHYLASHFDGFDQSFREVKELKAPEEGVSHHVRNQSALTPGQVATVLHYWTEPPKAHQQPTYARNHALLCCALATGTRRAELVAVEWRDVDLNEGTIHIRHGKGNKARDVAVVGDFALDALLKWQAIQGEGWTYVFTPVNKGGRVGPDRGLSPFTYYQMVKDVSASVGFDITTHAFRRTFITELLHQKVAHRSVQEQVGHANANTTMRYLERDAARSRREEFHVSWG